MKLKYLICFLTVGLLAALAQSCTDDAFADYGDLSADEGLETSVSLKVSLPGMSLATRADMDGTSDSDLNSLWVGIFNARTGECTYAGFYGTGQIGGVDSKRLPAVNVHGIFVPLGNNIDTKSGLSYIVAVGNPVNNSGYQYNPSSSASIESKPLDQLLPSTTKKANDAGFTWETYKNIAISRRALTNVVDVPIDNLVMSGIYYDKTTDPESAQDWETLNYQPVVIPATTPGNTVELGGAIHLRRTISQVKFRIKADNNPNKTADGNTIRVVSVSPVSYRVVNAPYTSWLHERKSPGDEANSGDVVKVSSITYANSVLPHKANYRTSTTYRGNQYITGSDAEGYEFDFWMLENKRRALSNENIDYDAREKEIKTPDASRENNVDNTGIYTALCGDDGPETQETMNNSATFVEIRCTVIYTEEGLGELNGHLSEGENVYYRKADAVYTVHLGGVKPHGSNEYDWNDFAHRRNHKYIYNVTIIDVDNIKVEAEQNGEEEEPHPGAEGVVSDVINPTFDLDAHYGVFNIKLSNRERTMSKEVGGAMPFRMEVYYNDQRIIIDDTNIDQYQEKGNTDHSEKLWQWIEFRPTTEENVLARYLPYGISPKDDDNNKLKTFRVTEFSDIGNYPGMDSDADDDTEQWYTVFVNEYVYEVDDDERTNNWVNYVNQSPRSCWIQIRGNTSKDKESLYLKSKYMVTQKSIQTFYDIPHIDSSNTDIDAIGLEHTNEVYGYTLRWGNVNEPTNSDAMINGKINQREYLRKGTNSTESFNWSDYFDQSTLQKITGINTSSYQYAGLSDHAGLNEGQIYYVPMIEAGGYQYPSPHPYQDGWTQRWISAETLHNFNPNASSTLTVMNACLNRNRDNDGDGKIDRDEIRWYLPSSGEMVDLVNGRNSLETPLMDYVSNPSLQSPPMGSDINDDSHHVNTRFHYVASNKRLLWAEEGITINTVSDAEYDWDRMGWQVRCVRALGTHLSDNEVNLSPAFTVDFTTENPRIYPTYFESKTLRDPVYGALPPHQETSTLNRISVNGFEFKKEFLKERTLDWRGQEVITYLGKYNYDKGNLTNGTHDKSINDGNAECRRIYGEGWRMPNIKEAAVLKLALNNADYNYVGNPGNDGIYSHDGYEIGNFYACTYREYGIVNETRNDKTGYYLGIIYESGTQGNKGRAQCLTQSDPTYYIRCVRDL